MDPDANYAEQIELALEIARGLNLIPYDEPLPVEAQRVLDNANRLSDLVIALNDWIANGGFAPKKFRGHMHTEYPHGEPAKALLDVACEACGFIHQGGDCYDS